MATTIEDRMKLILAVFSAVLIGVFSSPFAVAADAKADTKKAAPSTENQSTEKLDINSADEKALMTLDGIGDARAAAIIKSRPYRGKEDLVSKKILPAPVYEKIKDRIIAKQDAKKK